MELPERSRRRYWLGCALLPAFFLPAHAQSPRERDGISYEEYRRVFPQAPIAVRAEIRDGVATVFWQKPPAADLSEKLGYDPVIVRYRVYRLGRDHKQVLIGETRTTLFKDRAAPAGTTQHYAVTSVQRSGQESGLSQEVALQIP